MSYATRALAAASVLLMGAPAALADTISGTDFEGGSLSGWNTGTQPGNLTNGTITGNGTGVTVINGAVTFSAPSHPAVGNPTTNGAPNPYYQPAVTPTTWTFSPYGSYGAALQPQGNVTFDAATSALGLTQTENQAIKTKLQQDQQASGLGNPNPTNAAWITQSVNLDAGKIYTMAWNYIGTDYVPFNDGSITSLVYQGTGSTPVITVNNYVQNYALLGFTNPGTGDYSTGTYGSTGWQSSTYQVDVTGAYLLGFVVFNLGDTALSPVLLVDSQPGTTLANGQPFGAVAPNNPNAPNNSAPSTPPAPTLVSSNIVNNVVATVAILAPVSVTTVDHTQTEDGGRQRINRHTQTDVTTTSVTTTTTTPVTTDTYSDNSTVVTNGTAVVTTSQASTVATSHEYADFYGRVDQHEVMDKMGESLQGLLNHEPTKSKEKVRVFSKNYYAWSQGENGYSGTSFIYGGGVEIDIKPTWTIGGQYNNVTLNLNGSDSTSKLLKSHYGVFNMLRGNTLSLLTNAGLAQNNYIVSRNVAGVFGNDSQTSGQEWWVSNRLFIHAHKNITPFIGHTVRNYTRNAFTETGSSESARSVEGVNETYNVGEAGLRLETRFGGKKKNLFGVSVEGSYATDNAIEASATLDYKEIVSIQGVHQINNGVSNTAVSANVKFRF
jgi:hypothetical protein